MRRTELEARVRERLNATRPPSASDAERRAWHVVRAAHAARTPLRERRRGRRIAVAAAAAAALAALAFSPAGAQVGDWIGDVVNPAPNASRSSLTSLPAEGRLLVVADSGPWIVQDDGAKRRLGGFRDASWSPGGLHVVAARGRELVALDAQGGERWSRPAPGRVSVPRWSPDGFRIAYRSGSNLYVAVGDNTANDLLARAVAPTPPAWKPLRAPAEQVVAFAAGGRVRIVEVDSGRELGATPPGPAPREIWWAEGGGRLVTIGSRAVRVYGPRGRLLRTIELPRGLRAEGSALAPGGGRLALIARGPGGRASELLLMGFGGAAASLRSVFSARGSFEGLTWSIDGSVLVVGLPEADQWLFVRRGGAGGLETVGRIRDRFAGGQAARTGAFPRPAGWCYAKPAASATTGLPPCSTGAAP